MLKKLNWNKKKIFLILLILISLGFTIEIIIQKDVKAAPVSFLLNQDKIKSQILSKFSLECENLKLSDIIFNGESSLSKVNKQFIGTNKYLLYLDLTVICNKEIRKPTWILTKTYAKTILE